MPVTMLAMGGEQTELGIAEAKSAMAWWLEAGVDIAVQEAPRNWLKSTPAAAAVQEPAEAFETAVPQTLDLFRDWLATATSLPLATSVGRRVLPHGMEAAPIMLIADAPSSDDVAAGRPIAGEAWALTERMLAAIGIDAGEAYVAPLACFPSPGARLSAGELDACASLARRHVVLAKPNRLLLFGDGPARALLGKPLLQARGHLHKIEGVRTVATFAPRHLLKRPSDKALAWKDLLLLMEDQA